MRNDLRCPSRGHPAHACLPHTLHGAENTVPEASISSCTLRAEAARVTLRALMHLSRKRLEAGSAGIAEVLNGALQPSSLQKCKCNRLHLCGRHSTRGCHEVWRRALPGKNGEMAGMGRAHQSSLLCPETRLCATAFAGMRWHENVMLGGLGQELAINRPASSDESRALHCQSTLLACLGLCWAPCSDA